MTDQLISFETAKLAKEKGFNIPVFAMMIQENSFIFNAANSIEYPNESAYNWNSRAGYSIPTQSLLQKWLREEHNVHICIDTIEDSFNEWEAVILIKGDDENSGMLVFNYKSCKYIFDTYEEALEQGLIEALKLI